MTRLVVAAVALELGDRHGLDQLGHARQALAESLLHFAAGIE